ncbi:lipopolysaccharide biosynthesis protein [Acidiphilium sp. PA]|uniref:lipopolysaccharide biosynthesis protein n=1 Tax=Acidiphilium sp. PA TaxID=2871705 RepID=UPI0022443285|nr:lipopolysaccharide biosynthesis protein [Acidiphilium sp. PA]MCW8308620.1 lipopolysaccharide biosynthesis protein [Acidiphilium sp. PA]
MTVGRHEANPPRRNLQGLIAGYLPATIIPALVSLGVVLAYTRLLSPAEYGRYSLAFTALMVVQVSLFYTLSLSIVRFYPVAVRERSTADLIRTSYIGVMLVGLIAAALAALALIVLPLPPKLLPVLWLAVPLLLLRATLSTGQAVRRASDASSQYSLIECGQAIIGFAAGVLLVVLRGPTAENVMLGLIVGAAAMLAIGARSSWRAFREGRFDRTLQRNAWAFSAPLAVTYAVGAALQYGDRFMVAGLAGAQALGIYTVATVLVDRPTALAGIAITTATFPRVVRTLEDEGVEAARQQLGFNGILLLAVAAPACIGLMLIAPQLARITVGPAFRTGLVALLPIVAATALIRMMSAHFIDHAYHLARRSDLMLLAYGPFAALNLGIDVVVIPRFGVLGAAWAALGCLSLQCIISALLARRVFPLWLPPADIARVASALLPMIVVARLINLTNPWLHLAALVAESTVSYAVMLIAVDLAGLRGIVIGRCRRMFALQEPV